MENAIELVNWNEKYQPTVLAEIEGHTLPKMEIQSSFDNNEKTHWLLVGEQGSGKTMLAWIIGELFQQTVNKFYNTPFEDDFGGGDIKSYDASIDRGIDMIRGDKIKGWADNSSKGSRILDEADGLTDEAQNGLRGTMDKAIKKDKIFILTANDITEFTEPILSRCRILHVGRLTDKEILARLVYILKAENVPIRTEKERDYILQVAHYSNGDMRKAIDSLQRSVSFGKLDIDMEYIMLLDEIPTIHTLCENVIENGTFKGLREELVLMLYENTFRVDKYKLIKETGNWIQNIYDEGDMEEIYYLKCMISTKDCDYRLTRAKSPITQIIGMFAELRIIFLQFMEGDRKKQ